MYQPKKAYNAAGVFIYALETDRYLFLMRADIRHENTWALAGGRIEQGETSLQALERECYEEIGLVPQWQKIVPIETFTAPDGRFTYTTFFGSVKHEFVPRLNCEHHGYAWVDSDRWPRPLHPGLWSTVQFSEVTTKLLQLHH